jgi:2-oxoisovalerate dehydrogenase E2 component (dihydrolipoyl transacylase)
MGQYSFKLPDVGEGTAEAEIAGWRVKVGDRVEEDQPLVDMMTDKATVELTSPVAGVVQSIAGQAGDKAAVGSVLVILETTDAGSSTAAPSEKQTLAAAPQPAVAAKAETQQRSGGVATAPIAIAAAKSARAPVQASGEHSLHRRGSNAAMGATSERRPQRAPGHRPAASPAVRRRAEELGVKLQFLNGSGPGGRILHEDLDAYLAGGANQAPVSTDPLHAKLSGGEDIPVIGLRRQIAERMQLAKRHIPHFTYVEEVDVTELEVLRAHLNATRQPDQPKLTLLPFLMRALVRVLREFPQMNATYDDEAGVIHRSAPVHIGMAVQTTKGLLVAVIKHAEARDIWDCAIEVGQLATVARDGKASREQLTGSTITLTSLGPLGGVSATPVINRPEVAIIGPNKIVERPVVRDGQIVIRKMMNLSSSFDHRVIDGAEAAEFIQRLRSVLEQPATIFIR